MTPQEKDLLNGLSILRDKSLDKSRESVHWGESSRYTKRSDSKY